MKKGLSVFLILAMALSLCACSTDIRLSGSVVEDGEVNPLVEQAEAVLSFSTDGGEGAVIGVDVAVPGMNAIKAVLTVDAKGIGFTLPGIDDAYYVMDWAVLKDLAEDSTEMDFSAISSFSPADLPLDDLSDIFSRYFGLVYSLITGDSTTAEVGTYSLKGLQADAADAQIITISPSDAEWSGFFTSGFETAKGDEQLKALLAKVLEMAYGASEDLADNYENAEAFSGDMMAQFDDLLAQGLANADNLAAVVSGAALQIAMGDSRVYAVKISKDGMGLGYESIGEISDVRKDGLFLYMGESATAVLVNTLQNTEDAFTSYATSELITLEITATVSKTERTALGIPVSYLNVIVEEFGFYAFADKDDPDTVFEIGMVQNGGEDAYRITARTDGSPSDIEKPTAEPTAITGLDQLEEVFNSISEKLNAYVGA